MAQRWAHPSPPHRPHLVCVRHNALWERGRQHGGVTPQGLEKGLAVTARGGHSMEVVQRGRLQDPQPVPAPRCLPQLYQGPGGGCRGAAGAAFATATRSRGAAGGACPRRVRAWGSGHARGRHSRGSEARNRGRRRRDRRGGSRGHAGYSLWCPSRGCCWPWGQPKKGHGMACSQRWAWGAGETEGGGGTVQGAARSTPTYLQQLCQQQGLRLPPLQWFARHCSPCSSAQRYGGLGGGQTGSAAGSTSAPSPPPPQARPGPLATR
jgi:hypothetical protein